MDRESLVYVDPEGRAKLVGRLWGHCATAVDTDLYST